MARNYPLGSFDVANHISGAGVQACQAAARRILDSAYRLLHDQAARIGDEVLRQSFLNAVPTNVALGALWKATATMA